VGRVGIRRRSQRRHFSPGVRHCTACRVRQHSEPSPRGSNCLGRISPCLVFLPSIPRKCRPRAAWHAESRNSVFRWTPSPSQLTIQQGGPSSGVPPLAAGDIEQIRKSGITGSLSFDGGSRSGYGKISHAILIFQEPVSRPIELREPDATTVIYIQDGHNWKIFPSNARLLKRRIQLTRDASSGARPYRIKHRGVSSP
jgi:hypothetical protein